MIESTKPLIEGTVLIYTIHRVESWWSHVGHHMGFERSVTVSDLRGDGDCNIVDDFYRAYHRLYRAGAKYSSLFDATQVEDIIARCRLLRWLPRRKAAAMALAMAEAFERVLDQERPAAIVAFPIDRYVSDVLERMGAMRGIPFYELTASAVPAMSMLLHRGRLIERRADPTPTEVDKVVREIADPLFTPTYVNGTRRFTPLKWIKTFSYFRIRGYYFKILSFLKRDLLSLHYLDAQANLGHKPGLRDIRICSMVESDWRDKISSFPIDRRIFIGLQLFPEASIDYWIEDLEVIQYEDLVLDVAAEFSKAGFAILVKDHPLQFGFRQIELIERIKRIPNVIIVPYEESGNEVLDSCGVNFTCTGTLGLQAALLGKKSISTSCYYTTPEDFIVFDSRSQVADLPGRVDRAPPPTSLPERQRRIIKHLLKGSFVSDFFSFTGFDADHPKPSVAELGRELGSQLGRLGPDGEGWHGRHPWPVDLL